MSTRNLRFMTQIASSIVKIPRRSCVASGTIGVLFVTTPLSQGLVIVTKVLVPGSKLLELEEQTKVGCQTKKLQAMQVCHNSLQHPGEMAIPTSSL